MSHEQDDSFALAKSEGIVITSEEEEVYLAELVDCELGGKELKKIKGGKCYYCPNDSCFEN